MTTTPLPRPVAHLRVAKRLDGMEIVVCCSPSDKGATPAFVQGDLYAFATQARADLEAENKRLREALTDTLALLESYCGDLEESTRNQARAALKGVTP